MTLGEFLRCTRLEHADTLQALSDRTGLSVSFLSDLERGASDPSLSTLQKLARAYGLTVVGLLQHVDGFGSPVIPGLSSDELVKVQEYVDFLRWKRRQEPVR